MKKGGGLKENPELLQNHLHSNSNTPHHCFLPTSGCTVFAFLIPDTQLTNHNDHLLALWEAQ